MCGVPVHRADEYLQRLIAGGFRVAVCEQLEDPAEARKRGSKAVVRRDVVRLVTPGTLTEDSLLDAKARNYLTARVHGRPQGRRAGGRIALASLDISTGEFEVGEVAAADFPGEIVRLAPGEVIAADALLAEPTSPSGWRSRGARRHARSPAASFDSLAGERLLKAQLGVADLGGLRRLLAAELAAVGALLKYVELTQIGKQAVPAAAAPQRAVRPPADRRADAREPGAAALHLRRRARRACSPPSTARSPAPARASWPRAWRARCATCGDQRPARRGRLPARARGAARGRAARAARTRPTSRAPCRGSPCSAAARAISPPCATVSPRRSACARAAAQRARGGMGPAARRSARSRERACGVRRRPCSRGWRARWSTIRRICAATAASCARATRADLDAARAPARRQPQGDGRAGGQLRAGDRHQGAEGAPQQHPGLLHRGAGRRRQAAARPSRSRDTFRHRQTMAGAVRFTTAGAGRDREPHRLRRRAGAGAGAGDLRRAGRRHRRRRSAALGEVAAALAELDCEAALAEVAVRGGLHAARPRRQHRLRDPRRPPSRGRAGAARRQRPAPSSTTTACWRRPARGRGRAGFDEVAAGAPVARHRPQHGRQVHLPAPERADRRAGADGLVRAGALGPHRHRRPAVLARRRRRRSRPRPLHLHGRDGGDRRHPQPGHAALARDPRRDRPRHRHLRRPRPSPGRWWSTCTRSPSAARCSPRTTTS